jgi:DNA-binding Lrp family transcriptional regulator
VLITLAPRQGPGIEAALRRLPQVRTLHAVSGAFDLLAMVAADGLDELNSILDRVGQLEGVERTTSAVVLSTRIDR